MPWIPLPGHAHVHLWSELPLEAHGIDPDLRFTGGVLVSGIRARLPDVAPLISALEWLVAHADTQRSLLLPGVGFYCCPALLAEALVQRQATTTGLPVDYRFRRGLHIVGPLGSDPSVGRDFFRDRPQLWEDVVATRLLARQTTQRDRLLEDWLSEQPVYQAARERPRP